MKGKHEVENNDFWIVAILIYLDILGVFLVLIKFVDCTFEWIRERKANSAGHHLDHYETLYTS